MLLARSLGSNDLIIFIETLKFVFIGRRNAEATPSNDELLVMGFLARRTRVPVPSIIGAHHWAGDPYIVTSVIEGFLLSKCLGDTTVQSPNLCPTVFDSNLERAYHGMA